MGSFRLLHVSDLHFYAQAAQADPVHVLLAKPDLAFNQLVGAVAKLFGWHHPQLADAVAEYVFSHSTSDYFDAIVLTGDLATTGRPDDLHAAHEFVSEPMYGSWRNRRNQSALSSAGVPVFLLPGNHDRYQSVLGAPGGANSANVFRRYWRQGPLPDRLILEDQEDNERLAIIAADFSLASSSDARPPILGQLGKGRVYQDRLNSLKRQTLDVRRTYHNVAIVWAVHFPPVLPDGYSELTLIDGENLIDSAIDCGVRYILAGHVHARLRYLRGGDRVGTICAASATAASGENTTNFIALILLYARHKSSN